MLCGVVISCLFLSFSCCPSPCLSLQNLKFGNAGSILDEITNTPIQHEYGVVIWCLPIFSGMFVKFDLRLLEIRR